MQILLINMHFNANSNGLCKRLKLSVVEKMNKEQQTKD